VSAVLSLCKPHRIKASHRRRWKGTTGHSVYIMNNPLSGTDPTGYQSSICSIGSNSNARGCETGSADTSLPPVSDGKKPEAKPTAPSNGAPTQTAKPATKEDDQAGKPTSTPSATPELPAVQVKGDANDDLNMTADEYLEAVKNGLWKTAKVVPNGVKNNNEVKQSIADTNVRQPSTAGDVTADKGLIEFVSKIAKATAGAKIATDGQGVAIGEKFLSIGKNSDGQYIVQRIGILGPNGGDVASFLAGAVAMLHVHYTGIQMTPSGGDHSPVKFKGISSFVLTDYIKNREPTCCNVYEVGRVNNDYVYRNHRGGTPSKWSQLPGAK
jgi:hypothetical protein